MFSMAILPGKPDPISRLDVKIPPGVSKCESYINSFIGSVTFQGQKEPFSFPNLTMDFAGAWWYRKTPGGSK
jgi:hypothetical protein